MCERVGATWDWEPRRALLGLPALQLVTVAEKEARVRPSDSSYIQAPIRCRYTQEESVGDVATAHSLEVPLLGQCTPALRTLKSILTI